MATTTFTANKDARIANNGGTSLGAGASDFLPVGLYAGFLYRSLIGFSYSFAGMVSISSAILHLKTSSQYYVAFGSDPDIVINRITSSWSEGSSVSMSGSNAVEWSNQPSVDATDAGPYDVTTSENTWDTFDVTTLLQEALAAGTFYGLRIMAADEGTATDVTEFYAREYGSNDAYITVTYSTNTVPSAPTINSPTASELVSSTTPTISITHSDPQGDAAVSFDMQIDTTTGAGVEPDWTSLAWSTTTDTSDLTNPITKVTGTLSRGQWYALRARTADTLGNGAWSATRFFKVASLATATVTTPAAGHTAKTYYTAGTNTTPKFTVEWTYSCADGHAQASAEVKVYADSAGSPGSLLHTHSHSGAATSANLSGYAPTNGTKYHISVTPTCSLLAGTESTKNITRVRWGRASYYNDYTTAPATLGTPSYSATVPANSALTVEYSSTTSTTEPTTWYSTLAAAGSKRYLWHRITGMAWGSATPTGPTLNSLTLNTYNAVNIPDNWTLTFGGEVDSSAFVYGTQSLKITGTGAAAYAYQSVSGLIPGLVYVLSARIKSEGNSGAQVWVAETSTSTPAIAETPAVTVTQDFGELDANGNDKSRVYTDPFIAISDTVVVKLRMTGAIGTFAWFDALKLEQSSVVTPWTPGFIGGGTTIDAGGIQVDGTQGGVFRLRPSDTAYGDIEVDNSGFRIGDTNFIYSDATSLNVEATGTNDDLNLYAADNVMLTAGSSYLYLYSFGLSEFSSDLDVLGSLSSGGDIYVADGYKTKKVNPLGVGVRMAAGGLAFGDTYSTSISLAANGGSCVTWIYLPFPVRLQSWLIRNGDTATARSYEIALFKDTQSGSTATLTKVAESYASESFTPTVASTRTPTVATPDTVINPGTYCVVIRNSHATSTFNLTAKAAGTFVVNNSRTKTLTTALSATSTLDIATSWSSNTATPAIVLEGRNFGASWAW